jgi:hypothetical protein
MAKINPYFSAGGQIEMPMAAMGSYFGIVE